MLNKLYGDGINDDTAAIQELIDTVGSELVLPLAKAFYLISRPLELPSNFRLVLPRFCEIRLAAGSNCVMAKNKEDNAQNIEICGGVWNFNNKAQNPNPILTGVFEPEGYIGFGMAFFGVKGLRLTSMTMKDPVTFAVTLDTVSYFTVDNIVFDFNYGNPLATNMDGIHLNGNCHFGEITNLKGACYDDLVALNADEGTAGEISDITIRGIYSEDCHSAVRLLSANHPVRNVHISDVYGTYFQYCIGITRFYQSLDKGIFDAITLENICASKAERIPVYNKKPDDYVYPLIFVENKLRISSLKVSCVFRREFINEVETVYVGEETKINSLVLENINVQNFVSDNEIPVFVNSGEIKNLYSKELYNNGKKVLL
ncbi:MAG: hypothetical protein IJB86_09495 [Clostridia bacterium]|nr:hypothetical protein [Clostridia bacterium]